MDVLRGYDQIVTDMTDDGHEWKKNAYYTDPTKVG